MAMNYVIPFLVLIVVFRIFIWLIEKSNFDNKLINNLKRYKYFKFMLGLILIILGFTVEYVRHSLNEGLGQYNIPSIILRIMLLGIYAKIFYLIFIKNKA